MKTTRWRRVAAVAGVVALVAAACGTDGAVEAPDANGTPGAVQVTVVVTEFEFEPTDIQVPADTLVEIVFENRGVVEHDLTIDELGIEIYAGPGETVTETVTISAGTYEVYCSIPGHHEAGMHATLTAS